MLYKIKNRFYSSLFMIALLLSSVLRGDPFERDQLLDRVFAVHATKIIPQDGVLKAGLGYKKKKYPDHPEELIPDLRMTLHFSLGELVRPIDATMQWEDFPYAVITPLRDLIDPLINLNCYDTFILGNFKLTPSSVFIAPKSALSSIHNRALFSIETYDEKTTTLRQAIDEAIQKRGGLHITMLPEDHQDEIAPAFHDEIDANTTLFFSPILESNSHISFGIRFKPMQGDAYRLGELEKVFHATAEACLQGEKRISCERLNEEKKWLMSHFEGVKGYLNSLPCNLCDDLIREKTTHFVNWIHLIEGEIYIRTNHNKSLQNAPRNIWEGVLRRWSSKEEIINYLESVEKQLTEN